MSCLDLLGRGPPRPSCFETHASASWIRFKSVVASRLVDTRSFSVTVRVRTWRLATWKHDGKAQGGIFSEAFPFSLLRGPSSMVRGRRCHCPVPTGKVKFFGVPRVSHCSTKLCHFSSQSKSQDRCPITSVISLLVRLHTMNKRCSSGQTRTCEETTCNVFRTMYGIQKLLAGPCTLASLQAWHRCLAALI